jgi:hypothetical protein
MTLSKTDISQLEDARTVGGEPSVSLSDEEMVNLLKLVAADLDLDVPNQLSCDECDERLQSGFFDVGINDLGCSKLESTFSLDELLKRTLGEYADKNRMSLPIIHFWYSFIHAGESLRKYVTCRIYLNWKQSFPVDFLKSGNLTKNRWFRG